MITPEKLDEWIREVEERPSSGLLIVRYMAGRLRDLAERYETLLAENIQLRTEKKVEEYEAQIANLEYQLGLLKRQLGEGIAEGLPTQPGAAAPDSRVNPAIEMTALFIYDSLGRVLRVDLPNAELTTRQAIGRLAAEEGPPAAPARLLATGPHEELLLLFDSGRIVTLPAAAIPACTGGLDWEESYYEEPRASEELVTIVPIGRMSLAGALVQFSRRGCVKRMMPKAFETYVSNKFVGTGVKQKTDRTCELVLCAQEDRLVMASREGFLLTFVPGGLSYAIEETIRLAPTDHIIRAFNTSKKKLVVFLTENGKVIQREVSWLEPSTSLKTHGQPVFSAERRKSGVTLVGAEAVDETDWAVALDTSGDLALYVMSDLLDQGVVFPGEPERRLAAFTAFATVKA